MNEGGIATRQYSSFDSFIVFQKSGSFLISQFSFQFTFSRTKKMFYKLVILDNEVDSGSTQSCIARGNLQSGYMIFVKLPNHKQKKETKQTLGKCSSR